MVVKIGDFTLGMAIPMVLYDKGPMTKAECFNIFKPLEITNREFDEAWKHSIDWGQIRPAFEMDDDKPVYKFKAEGAIADVARYIPKLWESIQGDSPERNYIVIITTKEMHKERVLKNIKEAPGVTDAWYEK